MEPGNGAWKWSEVAGDEAFARLVPGPGFEPGLEDSKSSVLPLDHPGISGLKLVYGWRWAVPTGYAAGLWHMVLIG